MNNAQRLAANVKKPSVPWNQLHVRGQMKVKLKITLKIKRVVFILGKRVRTKIPLEFEMKK